MNIIRCDICNKEVKTSSNTLAINHAFRQKNSTLYAEFSILERHPGSTAIKKSLDICNICKDKLEPRIKSLIEEIRVESATYASEN